MKKVSVTYHAPKGDSKVAQLFGHTFHDGKAEEVEVEDGVLAKLKNNPSFTLGKESDAEPSKRDPAKEKAVQEAAKRDDDAKRQAQQTSPHALRGNVNPNLPGEPDDDKPDKKPVQAGRDH